MPVSPVRREGCLLRAAMPPPKNSPANIGQPGLAPGYVQGNPPSYRIRWPPIFALLSAQPEPLSADRKFHTWRLACRRSATTSISAPIAAISIWRNGELVDEPNDVVEYWRDDLRVLSSAAVLFEEALIADGIEAPHRSWLQCSHVPHFDPDRAPGRSADRWWFDAPMSPADAIRAYKSPRVFRRYTARRCISVSLS